MSSSTIAPLGTVHFLFATASLSNTANNYLLTTTSITVITALGAGIGSLTQGADSGQPDLGTATVFTNGTIGAERPLGASPHPRLALRVIAVSSKV